jgi:tetratricopeptide (TPR) repeat protein
MQNLAVTSEEILFLMEAGLIYRDAGKYKEAYDIFRGVMQLRPDSEVPYIAIGSTLSTEGQFEEAISYYQLALEKCPTSAYAYAQWGEALFMQKDSTAAQEKLNRALELDPNGPYGKMAQSILDVIR